MSRSEGSVGAVPVALAVVPLTCQLGVGSAHLGLGVLDGTIPTVPWNKEPFPSPGTLQICPQAADSSSSLTQIPASLEQRPVRPRTQTLPWRLLPFPGFPGWKMLLWGLLLPPSLPAEHPHRGITSSTHPAALWLPAFGTCWEAQSSSKREIPGSPEQPWALKCRVFSSPGIPLLRTNPSAAEQQSHANPSV